MYKTRFIDENWHVVLEELSKKNNYNKIVCSVPNYYLEDEALAEAIAKLLNENNKIIINLSV